MKLVILVPAYNEEELLPVTLAALPSQVAGCQQVETLVVDDGSVDATSEVAKQSGAMHVLQLHRHLGLSAAFARGLEAAVGLGADVVVVVDADNQYDSAGIEELVAPVVAGKADLCLGVRPIDSIAEFSWAKKRLQKVGSAAVSILCGTRIRDAVTGFRAYSREAALRLSVLNSYTYTVETLIQASYERLRLCQTPIRTRPVARPSRLVPSIRLYIWRMSGIMLWSTATYFPLRFFLALALSVLVPGLTLGIRFLYYFAQGNGSGHVQSLILCSTLINLSGVLCALAALGKMISNNRQLLQAVLLQQKREATGSRRGLRDFLSPAVLWSAGSPPQE